MNQEPIEEVQGVPVLADVRVLEQPRQEVALAPVAVQTVAVMGASMVVGAAAVALVHRHKARKVGRRRRDAVGPVLLSRSFLVDVHVLGERK